MNLEIFLRGRWQLLAENATEAEIVKLINKATRLGFVTRKTSN